MSTYKTETIVSISLIYNFNGIVETEGLVKVTHGQSLSHTLKKW